VSKRPARFTEAEVARVLRAAKASGMTIEITPDAIRVVPLPLQSTAQVDKRPLPVP
jgi:hypothetical protein